MDLLRKDLREIVESSNQDLIQENANVNGRSPVGMLSLMASSSSKDYAINNMLSDEAKEAYLGGYIHLHDLDHLTTGATNCCNIDLAHVLKGGFNTGHGLMREPQSIMSAMSLTSIILQANQNLQFGGQGISAFDHDLVPYVRKSYEKNLKMLTELNFTPCQETIENKAWQMTDRDVYQACESFIHNANSMHSRGGSQTPFVSINYGTNTTKEGRMLIKNMLLATQAGLGDGETPIFPIQIFRLKKGINFNISDPNHDLFRLSLETTAKRLYPNYLFLDAKFNLQHYDGTRESELSSMGCVDGKEVITYKYNDVVFVESFKRAWDRLSEFKNEKYGMSLYKNLTNVEIFDSKHGKFVKCKKIIKNPDMNNWYEIKLSSGRNLIATADHPLPVFDKGRTFVKDLKIGDKLEVVWNKKFENEVVNKDTDEAWLNGLILCDGSYQGHIVVSLGLDEFDIVEKFKELVEKVYGNEVNIVKRERGAKGSYYDVKVVGNQKHLRNNFESIFGGLIKYDRQIPNEVFSYSRNAKLSFLAGMIDADGYLNNNKGRGCRVQIGSTNKELALQQFELIQSLGFSCKTYKSNYDKDKTKFRYVNEFSMTEELLQYMASNKKKEKFNKPVNVKTPKYATVEKVDFIGFRDEFSYDVETESDYFDVSGIVSHNCRTRVIDNINGKPTSLGRGNLSFTTINLPLIAIESNKDIGKFFTTLEKYIDISCRQLIDRFEYQANKRVGDCRFTYKEGLLKGGEHLKENDTVREVLKNQTISVGFVGLAEALTSLKGKHHGQSEISQELGLGIIRFMRDKMEKMKNKTGLNFSLFATPAESYCGKALRMTREKHGVIDGVTDKEWFTNSNHIPVNYPISAYEKIMKEAPYHELTNAGHIFYVELKEEASKNIDAMEQLINMMNDYHIGYGSFNIPVDRCLECGHSGIIYNECLKCGNDDEMQISRIRRITGYLVGDTRRWNTAKKAEENNRVKHN